MRTALRMARLRAGLTQSEMARRVGLSRASYTNIEKGYKNPSLVTALLIASTLNKYVDELFSDDFPHSQSAKTDRKGNLKPGASQERGP